MKPNLPQGQERRKAPRVSKKLPIKLRADLFDLVSETHNLSSSGLYCQVDKYIELMTKLSLVMTLPLGYKHDKPVTKKIKCEGVVVRVDKSSAGDDKFNLALFFNNITEADRNNISRYIKNHLKTDAALCS